MLVTPGSERVNIICVEILLIIQSQIIISP